MVALQYKLSNTLLVGTMVFFVVAGVEVWSRRDEVLLAAQVVDDGLDLYLLWDVGSGCDGGDVGLMSCIEGIERTW